MYTDGGPNYRTTYWSVKLAHIATFIVGDLDMRIAARTAPSQSICNPAERCMSLLYLALQNISLKRNRMGANIELRVKPGTTLKKLGDLSVKEPNIKTVLQESETNIILTEA